MMKITGEQLKESAYRKRITSWSPFECSVCDYPIRYRFNATDPEVQHDPGCHCSDIETYREKFNRSSWEQLADYINSVTDIEIIKEIKTFWEI